MCENFCFQIGEKSESVEMMLKYTKLEWNKKAHPSNLPTASQALKAKGKDSKQWEKAPKGKGWLR